MRRSPFERFPAVAHAVTSASPFAANWVRAQCGTLAVQGRHLTSAYDRDAEARVQATRIDEHATEATVYGVALGDLPTVLLERAQLKRLRVVMLDARVVSTTLAHGVEHAWALDPRVEIVLGEAETTVCRPYAVAPASLVLADANAARLRDEVLLDLTAAFHTGKHAQRDGMLRAAMLANADRLRSDLDVATLFGSRVGATALLAAAGPTLTDNIDYISERRDSALLIAVTTALRPLERAGLRPDLAVVVDPAIELCGHFEGLADAWMAQVPLVYVSSVHPKVLAAWKGPRYGAHLSHPRYREADRALPRGMLYCSGTVTHTAVDLAVKMGVSEVVLLGTDFAYVHGRSHANGASYERGAPVVSEGWVLDGEGAQLNTDIAMIGYLRDLERYIAAHADVRFRLRSRRGAQIRGTTWI